MPPQTYHSGNRIKIPYGNGRQKTVEGTLGIVYEDDMGKGISVGEQYFHFSRLRGVEIRRDGDDLSIIVSPTAMIVPEKNHSRKRRINPNQLSLPFGVMEVARA